MPTLQESPRWQFFSSFEAELIEAIKEQPGSASEIARRTGYPYAGNLRFALSNLVARKVLSIGSEGYHISH